MGCVFSDSKKHIESPLNGLSLEFLIILKERDFEKKTYFSLYKKVKIATSKLPGNVHICSYKDVDNYDIKGLKLPYVLYTKLPKENIFISSDAWESEYFNSQTLELITIFAALGASEIKFKTTRDHTDSSSMGIHASTNLNLINIPVNVNVNAEIDHYEDADDQNVFDGQIKIKEPALEKYDNIDDLINKKNLYYTKNNYAWKSLISYKINNESTTKLKFNTTFYRGFHCVTKISADLEALGISVNLFNSGSKYAKTIFQIRFDQTCDDRSRDEKSRDDSRDESKDDSMSIYI
jgi:hypothetical protein